MRIFIERDEKVIIVRRENDAYCVHEKDIEQIIKWSIKKFGNSFEDAFDFESSENDEIPSSIRIDDLEKLDEELEGDRWEEVTQEQAHKFIKSLGLI